MPAVAGLGSTFNLPNYGGEILEVTPSETPFLSSIGGLNEQGETTDAVDFEWQAQDLGTPKQPEVNEGADAPALEERARTSVNNIVQPFHYAFGVTYTRTAATGNMAGLNNGQANPVQDEIAYQTRLKLIEAARDLNYTFINGVYQKPASTAQPRKTRGLLAAITTNVVDLASAALTETHVLDMIQNVWQSHGVNQDAQPTLIVNATLKRRLSKIFITDKNYREQTRNVGGVNLQSIETDFGVLNIMLERAVAATTLVFCHLAMCRPRYLLIPGSGFLFVEPLAKTGAKHSYQLYGEAGLQYGAEQAHGKILNAS